MNTAPHNTAPQSATPNYVKLPGHAKPLFGMFANERQRLWAGDDHLLLVTQTYMAERYRRFFYNDIKGISIQKSTAGAVLNIVFVVFLGVFALFTGLAFNSGADPSLQVTLILMALVFVVAILINTALGPTCECHILTPVQEVRLYCLGRLRTAERVVEYIRELVESAQGTTSEAPETPAATSIGTGGVLNPVARSPIAVHPASPGLYFALFAAVGADTVFTLIYALTLNAGMNLVGPMLSFAMVLFSFVAVIRQHNTDTPRSVRVSVWWAFIYYLATIALLLYTSVFIEAFQAGLENETGSAPDWNLDGFTRTINAVLATISGAIAAFGLYYVQLWSRSIAAQREQARLIQESEQ